MNHSVSVRVRRMSCEANLNQDAGLKSGTIANPASSIRRP